MRMLMLLPRWYMAVEGDKILCPFLVTWARSATYSLNCYLCLACKNKPFTLTDNLCRLVINYQNTDHHLRNYYFKQKEPFYVRCWSISSFLWARCVHHVLLKHTAWLFPKLQVCVSMKRSTKRRVLFEIENHLFKNCCRGLQPSPPSSDFSLFAHTLESEKP